MRTRSDFAAERAGQGRSSSVVRLVGIVVLASVATWFCAARVFWTFDAARIKMLRGPLAAVGGSVEVPAQDDEFNLLAAPAALIARVRNQSDAVQSFAFQVDGAPSCTVKVPAMTERRIDCSARAGWVVQSRHIVKIRGAPVPWTLEYLELASHHGHSTDPLRAIVLPAGSQQFRRPPALLLASLWLGLVLLFRITPEPFSSRAGRRGYLCAIATLALAGSAIAISPWLSPYLVVISPATFAAAALVSGLPQIRTIAMRAAPAGQGLTRARTWVGTHQPVAAATLAMVTTLATGLYGGRAIGGSDEYGYASQAELWLKGNLEVEQPFVEHAPFADAARIFSPLGYRPHHSKPTVIVPTYAPGLPMLLALTKLIGGQEAMFWVVPVSAGLLVLVTYGIGRRVGAETPGLIAAALVATSPPMLAMAMLVMTDVPVAAAWAGAFYFALGGTVRSAAAAGVLSSVAVLIRPNLAPVAGALVIFYLLQMRSEQLRRNGMWQLTAFIAALVPGVIVVGLINAQLYGSPLSSGYGHWSELFVLSRVPVNLRLYLSWFVESHTLLALAGFFALFVPLRQLWPAVGNRETLIVMAAVVVIVWATYCAWLVFGDWWYQRFLLTSWPFLMLGTGAVLAFAYRAGGRFVRPIIVLIVVSLGLYQLDIAVSRGVFGNRDGRRRFVDAAELVRRVTEPNSAIASLDHSGSIRYYGGRMTINFGSVPDQSFDAVVDWLSEHGVRTYLAIEEWELPEIRQRFGTNRCMRVLDGPPVAVLEWRQKMRLFDLTGTWREKESIVARPAPGALPTARPVAQARLVLSPAP
jgi:hypothetical protein